MSQEDWNLIEQSKRFYVNTYRRAGRALFISILINLSLGIVIYYAYISRPKHDFYATNGETPPVMLSALSSPNNSSVALLAADPDNDHDMKVIPQ